MPKWREIWREISAEAEEARTLMVRDRAKGEERFRLLIDKHGEDGMIESAGEIIPHRAAG